MAGSRLEWLLMQKTDVMVIKQVVHIEIIDFYMQEDLTTEEKQKQKLCENLKRLLRKITESGLRQIEILLNKL